MENTQKMSRVEQALQTMRDEIKNAILNEEIEMEFSPSDTEGYYAELRVHVDELKFGFAIADTYICYLNDFTRGMFPKGSEDFEKLTKLAKKHVKILTLEDRERINKLYAEIKNIKSGKEEA